MGTRWFLVLCLLPIAWPSLAQRPRVVPEPADLSAEDSLALAQYRQARTLVGAGRLEAAIPIFLKLIESDNTNITYYTSLREAYEALKRYDDAVLLIDRQLTVMSPEAAVPLRAEKARLLHLSGKEHEADDVWNQLLDSSQGQERFYRTVYESMLQSRLIGRAIAVLERGRTDTGRSDVFLTELAYLHGLNGSHDKAMEEYLDLLHINIRQVSFVRGRLSLMLQQKDALNASIPVAKKRIETEPDNPAYREIYAWLLSENEDFSEAFEQYRLLATTLPQASRLFIDFALKSADVGAFDIAASAFGEVLSSDPDPEIAAEAQLGLAHMHRLHAEQFSEPDSAAPHYEEAIGAYRGFLAQFPGHPQYPEVLRKIANLQQHVFSDPDKAEATLLEIMRRFRGSEAAALARFDLGQLAVHQNRLDEAYTIFQKIEAAFPQRQVLIYRSRYERALIKYYQGDFNGATDLTREIMGKTSSDVANDVLALRILIMENPGLDSTNSILQQYSRADLQMRQGRVVEAVATLDTLLGGYGSQHAIADDAGFLRAQALRKLNRFEDSLIAFGGIPLIHPNSPLADQSLFLLASVLEQDLGQIEEALSAYSRFLTQMPGSLLAPKVRARIRALQELQHPQI